MTTHNATTSPVPSRREVLRNSTEMICIAAKSPKPWWTPRTRRAHTHFVA